MVTLKIGGFKLSSPVVLAPMAGVTDLPFRRLCHRLGAGMVVGEMLTSDTKLWSTPKSQRRLSFCDEIEPRAIQIAGADPEFMADAARQAEQRGAQLIDINMGCPAKKVCNKAAGSALLRDEKLVERILRSVTQAVAIPVTLKIRTGWSVEQRNGLNVALLAEQNDIAALTVHGRTRACGFHSAAEYDTIAAIKARVSIPVIANGDISSASKALEVINRTGADGVMIGRAALGKPWIIHQIAEFLKNGIQLPNLDVQSVHKIMLEHVNALHGFYGEFSGVRVARKHVGWYLQNLGSTECPGAKEFRKAFNKVESAQHQITMLNSFFENFMSGGEIAA
ncbi:MAG: tRNA dihydrouridine synthase DusB [Pseudomonadales bacterium]